MTGRRVSTRLGVEDLSPALRQRLVDAGHLDKKDANPAKSQAGVDHTGDCPGTCGTCGKELGRYGGRKPDAFERHASETGCTVWRMTLPQHP